MKKILYTFVLFVSFWTTVSAQQTMLSSLYFNNYYLLNPAETGREKGTNIHAGYRAQWMGFEGAPTVTYLTGQHHLNKSIGVGGYVSMEKMSFISHLSGEGSFSYKLKISDDHKVYAGLSLGFNQTSIDLSSVMADDYTDNLLLGANTKGMLFNAKFGLTYVFKKNLSIGFSFPQLLENQLVIENSDNGVYDFARHWNFYTSYQFKLDEKIDFAPVFMLRNAQMVEHQFDLLANFVINKKYRAGLGLRQGVGFLVNLGAKVNDNIGIYYGYDFTSKSFVGSSGSHELMLSFTFVKKKTDEDGNVIETEEIPEDEEPQERKKSTRF